MNRKFLLVFFAGVTVSATAFGNVQSSRQESCTRDTLGRLKQAFKGYHGEYNALPKGTPKAVVNALTGDNTDAQNHLKIVFFEFRKSRTRSRFWRADSVPGDMGSDGLPIDGWGQTIVFAIDPATTDVTFRSLGPNGRDDAGQQDDIVLTYAPKR